MAMGMASRRRRLRTQSPSGRSHVKARYLKHSDAVSIGEAGRTCRRPAGRPHAPALRSSDRRLPLPLPTLPNLPLASGAGDPGRKSQGEGCMDRRRSERTG